MQGSGDGTESCEDCGLDVWERAAVYAEGANIFSHLLEHSIERSAEPHRTADKMPKCQAVQNIAPSSGHNTKCNSFSKGSNT